MTRFKKAFKVFATNEQAKRQDVLVWSKEFKLACGWFFREGKKQTNVATKFPMVYWRSIEDLTEGHGEVLGRCGNEFSLILKETCTFNEGDETSIVSVETGEAFDAKEFMIIPLNNRIEVDVTYSATGLVLGTTWEGFEGTYPSKEYKGFDTDRKLVIQAELDCVKGALTGTGDFSKQLGALLIITKETTIQVKGKPFVNTEVSREFIGDLSAGQMEMLDNEMGW